MNKNKESKTNNPFTKKYSFDSKENENLFWSQKAFASTSIAYLKQISLYLRIASAKPFGYKRVGQNIYFVLLEEFINEEEIIAAGLQILPLMVKDSSITGPETKPKEEEYVLYLSNDKLLSVIMGNSVEVTDAVHNFGGYPFFVDMFEDKDEEVEESKLYMLNTAKVDNAVSCTSLVINLPLAA
jgi:hypothetical protein